MKKINVRAIYRNRLRRLAKFLLALDPKLFDFGVWVDSKTWKGREDLSCGTTACALGWAAAMPEFRALGVKLVPRLDVADSPFVIDGTESDYTEVAWELFDLTRDEAEYIFTPNCPLYQEGFGEVTDMPRSPNWQASSKDVAQHILRFVKWQQTQDRAAA